ncbi:hypothetical protein SDC9_173029 [bioreactor metagenome]|uniref:Uncharacterized protein n=1 Tax=bioreactor metagenome TaxID=1076179 RepID=A0A645GFD1_9ZZZZ
MYLENLKSSFCIRHGKFKNNIKSTAAQKSGINKIYSVGCCQDCHSLKLFNSTHFCEKLTYDTLCEAGPRSTISSTNRNEGFYFVEIKNRRRSLLSFFEDFTNGSFTFSNIFRHKGRTFYRNEVNAAFVCQCANKQRLSCSGRSV